MSWTTEQQNVLKKHLKEDNWVDLMMQVYISADEVSLGKLDEDMTLTEYMSYGPSDSIKEITEYYVRNGATVTTHPGGIKIHGDEGIKPYQPKEKKNPLFSLEERRKICKIGHMLLEKKEISTEKAKDLLEV